MTSNSPTALRRRPSPSALFRFLRPAAIFLRGFIEEPTMVASVVPSSQATINAMLAKVDWDRCRLFVEYGPGVGTLTTRILDSLPEDAKLLAIDTNPRFVEFLKKTIDDPRLEVVLGSAEDVAAIVQASGNSHADYVISGLPFSSLPPGVAARIMDETYRVLRLGGAFMTYQFSTTARTLTAARFDRLDKALVLLNVPPCFLGWGWKDEDTSSEREAAE